MSELKVDTPILMWVERRNAEHWLPPGEAGHPEVWGEGREC